MSKSRDVSAAEWSNNGPQSGQIGHTAWYKGAEWSNNGPQSGQLVTPHDSRSGGSDALHARSAGADPKS